MITATQTGSCLSKQNIQLILRFSIKCAPRPGIKNKTIWRTSTVGWIRGVNKSKYGTCIFGTVTEE